MYSMYLAISVLVVCTYGAIMSQPMTYWRGAAALLLTKVYTLTMMGRSLLPLELKPVATVPSATAP